MGERPDTDPVPAGTGRRLGDFTLLRPLGKGSQGEVWEARQESLGRHVALKLLPPQMVFSAERLQRFQREAEAGGRLTHAGIVTVYAVGEHAGVHFIAQELVPGGRTLADLIDEARRLPEPPADWHRRMAALFAEVGEALHAAHGVGVIHRDVKPGNVLVAAGGRPKLADFGLARVQDEAALSTTGDLAGTPFYMSPEQVRGEHSRLDARTDVFSLGASLYEALTLLRPFPGDRQQIMEGILQRDPPDPRRVQGHVPRALAVICLKALEKARGRRYASAGEMAADLRRFLAGEPIRARPPGALVRATKWAQRRPRASTAGAVAVVAFAAVTWLWMDNRQDKREALEAKGRIAAALDSEREARAHSAQALAEAEAARQRAQAEREQSERVLGLLEDVILGADPLTLQPGQAVQPPEVLDRGARLAGLLDGEPPAQWRMVLRLGCGYRNVGRYAEAGGHLERAVELARATFGPDDARTATSHLELARVQRLTGAHAAAEASAQEALRILGACHGAGSVEALAAVGELGLLYRDSGRPDLAEERLRAYQAGCVAASAGVPSDATVLSGHMLGQFLLDTGRTAEAEGLLRLAGARADLLPEYPRLLLQHDVARLDDQLGRAAARAGRAAEAQRLDEAAEAGYRRVLARQRELLGDSSQDTLTTINSLGRFHRERGRHDLARPLLEEALALLERSQGPTGPGTLTARNNLALLEYAVGDAARAESIWRAIVAADRAGAVSDPSPVLAALSNLASLTRDDGRLQEAEALAREAVERTPAGEPELAGRQAKLEGIRRALAQPAAAAGATP